MKNSNKVKRLNPTQIVNNGFGFDHAIFDRFFVIAKRVHLYVRSIAHDALGYIASFSPARSHQNTQSQTHYIHSALSLAHNDERVWAERTEQYAGLEKGDDGDGSQDQIITHAPWNVCDFEPTIHDEEEYYYINVSPELR